MKIVSLVPSLTETLIDLNLTDEIIGRTKFCIHPDPEIHSIASYGGTKNPHIDKIIQLNPDLVIANQEENRKVDIEALREADIEVLVTDIYDIHSSLEGIKAIGDLTRRQDEATLLTEKIKRAFANIHPSRTQRKVLYLIWKRPWMSVGQDTYIHSMIEAIGFKNVFHSKLRYPEFKWEEIRSENIDYIFLSSEPYPFSENDRAEIEDSTGIKTLLVDGEVFSWYGSRILKSADYMEELVRQLS